MIKIRALWYFRTGSIVKLQVWLEPGTLSLFTITKSCTLNLYRAVLFFFSFFTTSLCSWLETAGFLKVCLISSRVYQAENTLNMVLGEENLTYLGRCPPLT